MPDVHAGIGATVGSVIARRGAVVFGALSRELGRPLAAGETAVNCHHNYVSSEHHFGADVIVTRKAAVRAREGEFGITPGQHESPELHRERAGQAAASSHARTAQVA
jgi:RNA-splicing ligase RtcB